MAGITVGAATGKRMIRIPAYNKLILLQFGIGLYCILVLVSILAFRHLPFTSFPLQAFIFLLIFGIALLAGLQFYMATHIKKGSVQSVSGAVYSADLLGAALGAILISTCLIPVLGITGSLLLIAGLNGIVAVLMLLKQK